MKYIDVHCHIDMMKNTSEIIKKAAEVIVVNNGLNIETNRKTLQLTKQGVKAALGIYPTDALKLSDEKIDEEIEFIKENKDKIIAIGEVGIDLKWTKQLPPQIKNFQKFIQLSKTINKPLIVHSRLAEKQTIEILEKNNCKKVVMHCFSGNFTLVKRIVSNGWFLSIPANVTFSEHFQKIVKDTPIESLLCETDSPYLHPIKGQKNNTPENVIKSYEKISEIKKQPLDYVKKVIFKNFNKLIK